MVDSELIARYQVSRNACGAQNALHFVEPGEASQPKLNHNPLKEMPRIKMRGIDLWRKSAERSNEKIK